MTRVFKINSVIKMKLSGKKLNKIRKDNGYTIEGLGEICGYSKSHMWKMCNGWEPVTRQVELTLRINGLI